MQVLSTQQRLMYTLIAVLLCILFYIPASLVEASTVGISPSTGSYGVGQSFTVTIQVDPQSKSVNAVEAKLSFDNTKLSVVSVSKTGSVFSLWTTEPAFSNTAGTIDLGGGIPAPFTAKSNIVTVTFKVLAAGAGKVSIASASVLAADGLGTDVYTGPVNASYTFTGTAPTPTPEPTPTPNPVPKEEPVKPKEEPSDAAITFGDPPRAPEAGSTVFLDPEIWYATKIGVFTWEVPFDVDSLRLDMSTSSEFEPTTVSKPPVQQISLNDEVVTDGIQYLTMQYKNQVGWGGILHRKIMIDTIPPEKFVINIHPGNSPTKFPLLTFEAKDTTSGIQKYIMTIGDKEPMEVTPDEAKLGYLLRELEDATYTIKVVAYDFAGNKTESTVPVIIQAGWHPPVEVKEVTSVWDLFKGKSLVIMLLILALIGQFVYMTMTRKRHEQKEQKLRKETREIQDQMEKIFSALRDEIYDQINLITKHERLSKKEKEAVEGLNQALEVSETLIEKEITDVSKILK